MSQLHIGLAHNLGQVQRFAQGSAQNLWLCSAYVSRNGLMAMNPLIDTSKHVQAVFGAGPLTDPQALRILSDRTCSIKLFPHFPDSEFHPKCYYGVRYDGTAWAAIGSANLTGKGVDGNVELLAVASGPGDHPFFADLSDWLEEVRSFALDLTPSLMAAIEEAHEAYRAVAATSQLSLTKTFFPEEPERLARAREFYQRMHQDALVTYIRTTPVFASYKLVILAILLHAPEGRLSLRECALKFHEFYLGLEASGLQPERSTTGSPPRMLTPSRYRLEDVERLLLEAPRQAFRNSGGVVVFREDTKDRAVALARSIWAASSKESRQAAFLTLVSRLEEYYQQHAGTTTAVQPILARVVQDDDPS